jgi:hypothetical protein
MQLEVSGYYISRGVVGDSRLALIKHIKHPTASNQYTTLIDGHLLLLRPEDTHPTEEHIPTLGTLSLPSRNGQKFDPASSSSTSSPLGR